MSRIIPVNQLQAGNTPTARLSGWHFAGWLLLGLGVNLAAEATELGVMWRPLLDTQVATTIAREREDHHLHWVRQMPDWPPVAGPRSVVWWPAVMGDPARTAPTNLWSVFQEALSQLPAAVAAAEAVEVGNEPDLHFTAALPDRMAAVLKAAWHGLKGGRPERRVLMPALAAAPGPYAELLAANGVSQFTDAWNVHYYGWAQDYDRTLEVHARFRDRVGGRGLPLWVTELGPADFPTGRPDLWNTLLARQRTFFEQAAVRGEAGGAEQQWAFCAGPYVMRDRDQGLHNADGSPRPAWDAWLSMARQLREAKLIHQLRDRRLNAVMGWVFEVRVAGEIRWWTVLASPNRRADIDLLPLDRDAVPAPASSVTAVRLRFPASVRPIRLGFPGAGSDLPDLEMRTTVSATNNLHLLTAPGRFTVDGCDWETVRRPAELHPSAPRPGPSPVVITVRPIGVGISEDKPAVAYRYPTAQPVQFEIIADNFGTNVVSGKWRLSLPAGWKPLSGSGLSENVTIAGRAEKSWRLWAQASATLSPARRSQLTVDWRGKGGSVDSAAVVMAAAGAPVGIASTLPAEWQGDAAGAGWQHLAKAAGVTQWWITAPGNGPWLMLPLANQRRWRRDDVLRLRLRCPSADADTVVCRLDLLTGGRQVFQRSEDTLLTGRWQILELRLGDTTPAIWSHAGHNEPTDARYLRLGIFGLRPEQLVELAPVELIAGQD